MMDTRRPGVLRARFSRRSARLTAALVGSVVALGLAPPTVAVPAAAVQTQSVVVANATRVAPDLYEERVQRLVNRRRASRELPRLRVAACAEQAAEEWSAFLALNGLFEHRSMTQVLDRCNARYAGETLGRGTMSPRKLVRMWMRSPGHRAVLLSPKSRRIGVGAATDLSGRWVVAANFIRF
jgi:uncharacterized protein YkwD